jgi:hypothetical protein
MDRYFEKYTNDNSSLFLRQSVFIYEGFENIEFNLSSDVFLKNGFPQRFLIPDRFFLTLKGIYSISDLSFEFGGVIKENIFTSEEIFLNLSYYFSPIEFISIAPSINSYYDFKGVYFEFKLVPSLFLPLSPTISISIPVSISFLLNGYNEIYER